MDVLAAREAVLSTLQQACSQQAQVLKPAEQQLKEWESQPGFYSVLQSIFSNHSESVNVRWLAVLCFKNGVDRYWRRNAPNALKDEEKTYLKQQLISSFSEPIAQIATQQAVLIGKIARLDCPHNWDELVPTLLTAIHSDEQLLQQRALLTFYHVTKMLASKRLPTDRKMFEELTSQVFGYICELWQSHTHSFLAQISGDQSAALVFLDHSLLTLKVLRKLAIFGLRQFTESSLGIAFINNVFEVLHRFLHIKKDITELSYDLEAKREKYINNLTKVLLDFQEMHSESFLPFIQPSLELATQYNFTPAGQGLLFERFQVNTLNLMRSILRCETYRINSPSQNNRGVDSQRANAVIQAFFTKDTLREICQRIISQYFPMTQENLSCWDSDPEEFVAEEGGDTWKFCLRPCVENLYLTLMKEYTSALAPIVAQLFMQHLHPSDPSDLEAILTQDAVFNAVGQASFDLFDEIKLQTWIESDLMKHLSIKSPNYRILRRRVIWLVGCWVGVQLSPSLRPSVYQAILPHLEPPEDLVVRLETANTLRALVDDFDFQRETFLPYLERCFGLLYQLLRDVSECETKMQVLHVMSFLIEQVGRAIQPYAAGLIQYLPSLWDASADHNMLRCAILTTLVTLVQGFGDQCVHMHNFLIPVIHTSTDAKADPHVYLMEDGLDLWLWTLQCSPAVTDDLLALYVNIPALLEFGSETLVTCLKIIETYIILAPKEYIQRYSESLATSLSGLMTDLKTEGVVMVLKVVELVCQVFPAEGPALFKSMLAEGLRTIIEGEAWPMIISVYMSVFSRVILGNREYLVTLLGECAKEFGSQGEALLGLLLDNWIDKLDNITEYDRRKLSSLALLSLLTSNSQVVLQRFGGIAAACTETLHDVCNCDEDGIFLDSLVMDENGGDEMCETEHEYRKRKLSLTDPVHRINLRDYVKSQFSEVQRLYGAATWEQILAQVDPDVLDQLQYFIK